VTDRTGALQTLEHGKAHLGQVHSILCDGGYTGGAPFAQGMKAILGEQVTVQIAKRNELHTFKVMPKRNCERKLKHQFAIHPSNISGADPQKIADRLLGNNHVIQT